MKPLVYSLIPARGGSKGVPGKNLRLLGGYPLIAYSIAASKLTTGIQRTIVSTDSQEIALIAKEYGAEVPFLRPAEYARDTSPDLEFVLHALNWMKKEERRVPDYFVHLRPTTPFRDPQVIVNAINMIVQHPEATSLRSAHPAAESPYKWFIREGGYFKSILSQSSNDEANKPRQCFPEVYIPDGYADVLKVAFIDKQQELLGERMLGFISPVCHEVDQPEDLDILEWQLKQKTMPVYEFLKQSFPQKGKNVG
ncbi:MAG: acylneuraminate cytidylyltransferase family protein [Candidatus Omnitrophica bacterium]|nr:acylneuraminate cytidylyltransferase family protein [Candidatus Omnitrophota bacterium]MDD5652672.1 acylneuraminate cytidylyltransferase family protein [Candidatus Omnitrophota bacterium]